MRRKGKANQTGSRDAVVLDSERKVYGRGGAAVVALDDVSIAFARGTFTPGMGPSGSGKSTFLEVAAGLDRPTSGRVTIDGTDLGGLRETALTKLRRERIGFIFQSFNLLPVLTRKENVILPNQLAGGAPPPRAC